VANMDPALIAEVVAEADRRKLPVFAHPQNSTGLVAALAGGVDVLAHTVPAGPPWKPEFVARLREARVAVIPTLTLFRVEGQRVQLPRAVQESWQANATAQVQALHAAGGEILFGTDAGYITQFDPAEEYQLLAKAGLDSRAVLTALTTAPAARFGRADRSGRVATGFDADLVILDADPAADVAAFARVHATLRAGQWLSRTPKTSATK
jgi:imidazolonepropionase-like amidohydrolase